MNNIIKNNKNFAISFIRVVTTLMIIVCHALNENPKLSFLGQVFNVGVFIFIFLSGYLYGKKEIKNTFNWLKRRANRILVPMYVFMIFLFIIRGIFLNYGFEIKRYIIYLFNMQALLGGVQGGLHLWFLTAIMLCYLITPILDKYKYKIKDLNNKQLAFWFIGLIILQVLLSYATLEVVGIYCFYLMLYIFSYYYSYLKTKDISKIQLVYLSVLTMLGLAVRLVARIFIDGSILYQCIIVLYSHAILGIWIFFMLSKISGVFLCLSTIVSYFDNISFDLYIVHYMFFVGPFRVMGLTKPFIINSLIALMLSVISAIVLNFICKQVYRVIK